MKYLLLACLIVLVSCNLISPSRKPAQYKETDESVVKIMIPPSLLEKELASLTAGNSIIKNLSQLRMDPLTNIISLRMTLKYPLQSLFNYELKPKTKISEEQDIEMAFSLPKAKTLAMTKYLGIEFHKFKINGDDYLNAFSVVASVIQTILANSNLLNYVFDQTETSLSDYSSMMAEVIETNGIIVNQALRKISFKLNLKYFDQLGDFARYEEFRDIRLWQFSPALFKGTQQVFFNLEAGFGTPSSIWLNNYDQRIKEDTRTIMQVREELYSEYSNIFSVKSILVSYLDSILVKEKIQYSKLSPLYKNEVDRIKKNFETEAMNVLSTDSPTFQADPEDEYINFISHQKEKIKNFVSDLDRRIGIDSNILAGGSYLPSGPLLTKRVGLDALNGAMNFLRDYEYEGQQYIKEAYISIAPQIPGLIAKGKIYVDLNSLLGQMDTGLLGEKVHSKIVETSTGIPFELVLETSFEDNSILGLDAKSISLFEGDKKLIFNRTSKNQNFLLDFLKIYLAQSIASLEFDIGGESNLSHEEETNKKFKELIEYFMDIKVAYSREQLVKSKLENILEVMKIDITKNPQVSAGEDYITKKSKILFGEMVKYDSQDGLFKLKLDPRIAMGEIKGVQNKLQVWNIVPLFSKEFNNTFLEVSVGAGLRGKNYVQTSYDRRNDLDNANFVGIYNDNNRSTVDLLASINFDYVESYVNQVFKEIVQHNNGDYENELAVDKEQTHYVIDHIQLDMQEDKKIVLDLNASVVKKKKGGLFGWGKWKIDKNSYAISAEIELESKSLSQVQNEIRSHQAPIYYSEQLIGIQLNSIKLKFGKPSLVNQALSKLTNLNMTTDFGTKLRSLMLNIVNLYFQSTWKKQDKNHMFGHSLEEIVRVFTTESQILLMLNPRSSGAAFELKLTGEEENFTTKSIKVDSQENSLHIAFTAATAMAKVDKRELINIVKDTNFLLDDLMKINNKNQFIKEMNDKQIVNKLIINSDEIKLSLYNRLIQTMRHYDPILSSVNISFPSKNAHRRLTTCGPELMYFAATSYALLNRLDKLIKKIDNWKIENKINYYHSLKEAKNKLVFNIYKPLMEKYKTDFHQLNNEIVKTPYSYWTSHFYPDAYFTEVIYNELSKED